MNDTLLWGFIGGVIGWGLFELLLWCRRRDAARRAEAEVVDTIVRNELLIAEAYKHSLPPDPEAVERAKEMLAQALQPAADPYDIPWRRAWVERQGDLFPEWLAEARKQAASGAAHRDVPFVSAEAANVPWGALRVDYVPPEGCERSADGLGIVSNVPEVGK
jgi:hypothetical protein